MRNERMKVSSDSGFWQFHQKGIFGRPLARCGNIGGTGGGGGGGGRA